MGSISASLFCALFAAIYEAFSYGVYSYFMLFAFVLPLLGCALPYSIMALTEKRLPTKSALRLWNSGIAILTVGSILQGVLEIYGTTNGLMLCYPISGIIFCIMGFGCWMLHVK